MEQLGSVTDSTNSIITGTYHNTDTTKTHLIRVFIKWNDDNTQTMNNYDDTQATISNTSNTTGSTNAITSMSVTVSFTQIA